MPIFGELFRSGPQPLTAPPARDNRARRVCGDGALSRPGIFACPGCMLSLPRPIRCSQPAAGRTEPL